MGKGNFNIGDDFQTAMLAQAINGVSAAAGFARSVGLSANVPVILGRNALNVLLPPDTGTTVAILSTNAANAGAVMRLDVLDVDFLPRQVEVEITGAGTFSVDDPLTGAPMVITRLNGAANIGSRDGGEIEFDLTVHETGAPANVYGVVPAGPQEMQQAVFTVPAGRRWAVTSLAVAMEKDSGSNTVAVLTLRAGAVGRVMRRVFAFSVQRGGSSVVTFNNEELVGALSPADLMMEVESSSNGATVAGRITIRMVEI